MLSLLRIFHILSSTLALGVLFIGALQSISLGIQEYALHYKQWVGWGRVLPSLEKQEARLFRWIGLGFILLTVVLVTSLWFFRDMVFTEVFEKSLFALMTWSIFAILLGGRYFLGWRGFMAIGMTWGGVALLALTYFFRV